MIRNDLANSTRNSVAERQIQGRSGIGSEIYQTFQRFRQSITTTLSSGIEFIVQETEIDGIRLDKLSQFDNVILTKVLIFCDIRTACSWSATNRRFFRFVYASPEADQLFWKREFIRKFPNRPLDHNQLVDFDEVNAKLLNANLHYFHMLRSLPLKTSNEILAQVTGGSRVNRPNCSKERFDEVAFPFGITQKIIPESAKRALYGKCLSLIQWQPGCLPLEFEANVSIPDSNEHKLGESDLIDEKSPSHDLQHLSSVSPPCVPRIRASLNAPNLLNSSIRRGYESTVLDLPTLTVGAKLARRVNLASLLDLYTSRTNISNDPSVKKDLTIQPSPTQEEVATKALSSSDSGNHSPWELHSGRTPRVILSSSPTTNSKLRGLRVHSSAVRAALELSSSNKSESIESSPIFDEPSSEGSETKDANKGEEVLPHNKEGEENKAVEDGKEVKTQRRASLIETISAASEALKAKWNQIPQAADSVLGLNLKTKPLGSDSTRRLSLQDSSKLSIYDDDSDSEANVSEPNAHPLLKKKKITVLESLLSHPTLRCDEDPNTTNGSSPAYLSGLSGDGYLLPLAGRCSWRAEYVAAFHMSFSSLVMLRGFVSVRDQELKTLANKMRMLRFIVLSVVVLLAATGILASKQTSPEHYLPVLWSFWTLPSTTSESDVNLALRAWDKVSKNYIASSLSTLLVFFLFFYVAVEFFVIGRRVNWRARTLSMLDRHRDDFNLWVEEKSNILHVHALQDFILDDSVYRTSALALTIIPAIGGMAAGLFSLVLLLDFLHRGFSNSGAGYLNEVLRSNSSQLQKLPIVSLGNCIGSYSTTLGSVNPYPNKWEAFKSEVVSLTSPYCETSLWGAMQHMKYNSSTAGFVFTIILLVVVPILVAWGAYVILFHRLAQRSYPSEKLVRSFTSRLSHISVSPSPSDFELEDALDHNAAYASHAQPSGADSTEDTENEVALGGPRFNADDRSLAWKRRQLILSADCTKLPSLRFVALMPERLTVLVTSVVSALMLLFSSLLRGGNSITDARVAFVGSQGRVLVDEAQTLASAQTQYISWLSKNFYLFNFSAGYFWGHALPCLLAITFGGCVICIVLIYNRVGSKLYRYYMRRLEKMGEADLGISNFDASISSNNITRCQKSLLDSVLYGLMDAWSRTPYACGPLPNEAIAEKKPRRRCCAFLDYSQGLGEICTKLLERIVSLLSKHDLYEMLFLLVTPIVLIHMATDLRVAHLLPLSPTQDSENSPPYDMKKCTPLGLANCIDVDSTFVTWSSLTFFLVFSFLMSLTFTVILVYRRLRLRSSSWWWLTVVYPFYVTYVASLIKIKRYVTILNEVQDALVNFAFSNQMEDFVIPHQENIPIDQGVVKLYRSLLQVSSTMSSLGYFGYPGVLAFLAALMIAGLVSMCTVHLFLALTSHVRKKVPKVYDFVTALRQRELREKEERRLQRLNEMAQIEGEISEGEQIHVHHEQEDDDQDSYDGDTSLSGEHEYQATTSVLLQVGDADEDESDNESKLELELDDLSKTGASPSGSNATLLRLEQSRLQPISSSNPFATFVSRVAASDQDSICEALRPRNILNTCQDGYDWVLKSANDPDVEELDLWLDYQRYERQRAKALSELQDPL